MMFMCFKLAWLNNLHSGNIVQSVERISQGSTGFFFGFSESCCLNCTGPDLPTITDDAFSNLRACSFLSTVSNKGLKRRMEAVLKKTATNLDKFDVNCIAFGSLKRFRFEEKSNQNNLAFVELSFDTSTCTLVRIDNFCQFIEHSELLRQMND